MDGVHAKQGGKILRAIGGAGEIGVSGVESLTEAVVKAAVKTSAPSAPRIRALEQTVLKLGDIDFEGDPDEAGNADRLAELDYAVASVRLERDENERFLKLRDNTVLTLTQFFEKEHSALESMITELKGEANRKKRQLESLQKTKDAEIQVLRDAAAQTAIHIQDLAAQAREQESRLEKNDRQFNEASKLFAEQKEFFADTKRELEAKLVSLQNQINDAEIQYQAAFKEKALTAAKLSDATAKIDKFHRELSRMQDESWALDLEVTRLTESETELRAEIKGLTAELTTKNRVLSEFDAVRTQLSGQISNQKENYQKLQAEFSEATDSFQARVAELEREVAHLNREREQFLAERKYTHVKALDDTRAQVQAEIERARRETDQKTAELTTVTAALKALELRFSERMEEFNSRREELNDRLSSKEVLLKNSENEVSSIKVLLQTQTEQFNQERVRLLADVTKVGEVIAASERRLVDSERELKETKERLETARGAHSSAVEMAELTRASFEEREDRMKEELARIRDAMMKMSNEFRIKESELNEGRRVIALSEAMRAASDERELRMKNESEQVEVAMSELATDLTQARRFLKETQERLEHVRTEQHSTIEVLELTRATSQAREMRLNTLTSEFGELQRTHKDTVERLNYADQSNAIMKESIERAESANQTLAAKVEAQEAELNGIRAQLAIRLDLRETQEKQSAQIERREIQLRHYAAAISNGRSEVLRSAQILANEIQASASMNPVRDYMKVTEFELAKLETQLKVTPTLSAERPKLEQFLKKMIDQREFLKTVLENSSRQLKTQADAVRKITEAMGVSLPPTPPKSRP